MIAAAAGFGLVTENRPVDADVRVVTEMVFRDVVQVDAGHGPADFRLNGRCRQQDLHNLIVTIELRATQGRSSVRGTGED